jgi:hypothetical protein
MRKKIRQFWSWYEQVREPYRFVSFMAFSAVVLLLVPQLIATHYGIDFAFAQVPSLLLMFCIAASKEI